MVTSFKIDKRAKEKLALVTKIGMLLMAEKGIRGEICHAIHQYVLVSYVLQCKLSIWIGSVTKTSLVLCRSKIHPNLIKIS